jgi:[ribosomal protein S18]-alanine N-acetyltransferase
MNAGSLRLLRGNSGFLSEATEWVARAADGQVLSPALYPTAVRIWERAGYRELLRLNVMEKAVRPSSETPGWITTTAEPDFGALEAVDRTAFDRFWHMGAGGLVEAFRATPRSVVVEARQDGKLAGYAMIGSQAGSCFVQRVAVDPTSRGRGLGSALLNRSEAWARRVGAVTMILNVRPDNEQARNLYKRHGFQDTVARLHVLSFPADSLHSWSVS